jgi:hypothetical protein
VSPKSRLRTFSCNPGTRALKPPVAVKRDDNWPLAPYEILSELARSVASPKKLRKPTTSVIVVRVIEED